MKLTASEWTVAGLPVTCISFL